MSDFRCRQLITSQNWTPQSSPQHKRLDQSHLKRRRTSVQKTTIYLKPSVSSTMNIKDFMQVQRKKMRGMMIMKSFQKSNTEMHLMNEKSSNGFKGGKVVNRKKCHKNKFIEETQTNEKIELASESVFNNSLIRTPQKPNIMVNLTLYRKSFREKTSPNSQQLAKNEQKQKKFNDTIRNIKRNKTQQNKN